MDDRKIRRWWSNGTNFQLKISKYKKCNKKTQKNVSEKNAGKLNQTLCIAGGNVKRCSCCEKLCGGSLNIKNKVTVQSSNPTSGYVPKRIESRDANRYLCVYVHSNIIHNSQKVGATQVHTNRWLGKQNVLPASTEYYSALKRREKILIHATT